MFCKVPFSPKILSSKDTLYSNRPIMKNGSKGILFILIIFCISFVICGCANTAIQNTSIDTVMKPGMTITFNHPDYFPISITAGNDLKRYYMWKGETRSVTLWPRAEKWNGHYGAYFPGSDHHWKKHDGITRLITEEAVLNYPSYDYLLCALGYLEENSCYEKYFDSIRTRRTPGFFKGGVLHTDSGLCVGIHKAKGPGDGGTLYVWIFQIQVNGQVVHNLPGSSNDRIHVYFDNKRKK